MKRGLRKKLQRIAFILGVILFVSLFTEIAFMLFPTKLIYIQLPLALVALVLLVIPSCSFLFRKQTPNKETDANCANNKPFPQLTPQHTRDVSLRVNAQLSPPKIIVDSPLNADKVNNQSSNTDSHTFIHKLTDIIGGLKRRCQPKANKTVTICLRRGKTLLSPTCLLFNRGIFPTQPTLQK